jgi:hypothetical protein
MTDHYVHGVYIPCAKAKDISNGSFITVKVWDGSSQPGPELESVSALLDDFTENAYNYLEFDTPVLTDGNFFIGFEITYLSSQDTFAVFMAHDRIDSGGNSAYVYSSAWNSCNSLGLNTSFAFETKLCNSTKSTGPVMKVMPINNQSGSVLNEKSHPSEVNIYPNPTYNFVTLYLGDQNYNDCSVKIYDVSGRLIEAETSVMSDNKLFVDLKKFDAGMYYFEITTTEGKLSKKVTIVK